MAWEICASLKLPDGTVVRAGDTVACRVDGRPYARAVVRIEATAPSQYYYVVTHGGAESYWPGGATFPCASSSQLPRNARQYHHRNHRRSHCIRRAFCRTPLGAGGSDSSRGGSGPPHRSVYQGSLSGLPELAALWTRTVPWYDHAIIYGLLAAQFFVVMRAL